MFVSRRYLSVADGPMGSIDRLERRQQLLGCLISRPVTEDPLHPVGAGRRRYPGLQLLEGARAGTRELFPDGIGGGSRLNVAGDDERDSSGGSEPGLTVHDDLFGEERRVGAGIVRRKKPAQALTRRQEQSKRALAAG